MLAFWPGAPIVDQRAARDRSNRGSNAVGGAAAALSPWAALHWRLPIVGAGAGALAAVGYTVLTGAEVPTIRSCVAALLIVLAMALGRAALTLRLVAAGAFFVLALWPEALMGASFSAEFRGRDRDCGVA